MERTYNFKALGDEFLPVMQNWNSLSGKARLALSCLMYDNGYTASDIERAGVSDNPDITVVTMKDGGMYVVNTREKCIDYVSKLQQMLGLP